MLGKADGEGGVWGDCGKRDAGRRVKGGDVGK